jgi:RNA polymerase sigma factor (sigma-70 family)
MMGPREPASLDQDRALVESVLARVPGAFEALVRTYQGLCWRIIHRMVRDPEDARELCQETFLRVHRHLSQYRFESSFRSWLGQVAYSVAVRYLKRKRLQIVAAADTDTHDEMLAQVRDGFDLESAYADGELVAHVRHAIEELSPMQRTLLAMYHFEEMSIGEIALVIQTPEGTVKSHLFRARAALRVRLQTILEKRG